MKTKPLIVDSSWLRSLFSFVASTPLHPQWLVFRQDRRRLLRVAEKARGMVLDIGCADQPLRNYLGSGTTYIGLDYPATVESMYHTEPDVFGDAQRLPIANSSIDTIVILEVVEHLPSPDHALKEIRRVLKPDGICLLSVPFLYPVHDAPHDFQRLTIYGLEELCSRAGLRIKSGQAMGHPVETSMILLNLAFSKTAINAIESRKLASLLGLLLPIIVPMCNMFGWVFSTFGNKEAFMPHGYFIEAVADQ